MAYLALFFAMGGTAYAAAKWTGAEIVDGSLTGADVAADSLTGADIAPGSIQGADLDPDAIVSGGSVMEDAVTLLVTDPVYWFLGPYDTNQNTRAVNRRGPPVRSSRRSPTWARSLLRRVIFRMARLA